MSSKDITNIENLSVEDNNNLKEDDLKENFNNMTVKELRDEYKKLFNIEPKSRIRKDDLINQIIEKTIF